MSLTSIILTFNEEIHLARCIESLRDISNRIVVVDSGSTDRTVEIAESFDALVLTHPFRNQAEQFNWGLDNAPIETEWVLRLDADEYLTPEARAEIPKRIRHASPRTDGFTLNRQIHFQGRWIRHGGIYPKKILRLFRFGRGRSEQRWMDEHIIVDGDVEEIDADFIDDNKRSLSWWTEKHNKYSSREVVDILLGDERGRGSLSAQARRARFLKHAVYGRLPPGVRPVAAFTYRYVVRGGVLDGWQGLVFHGLQGLWYRFLVDAKLMEARQRMRQGVPREAAINDLFGLESE